MSEKRQIEVFTAGCPLCDPTVKLVKELACESCEVKIYDLNKDGMERAKEYGVTSVPSVAVNGSLLDCCQRGGPTRESLQAAGIGKPL